MGFLSFYPLAQDVHELANKVIISPCNQLFLWIKMDRLCWQRLYTSALYPYLVVHAREMIAVTGTNATEVRLGISLEEEVNPKNGIAGGIVQRVVPHHVVESAGEGLGRGGSRKNGESCPEYVVNYPRSGLVSGRGNGVGSCQ